MATMKLNHEVTPGIEAYLQFAINQLGTTGEIVLPTDPDELSKLFPDATDYDHRIGRATVTAIMASANRGSVDAVSKRLRNQAKKDLYRFPPGTRQLREDANGFEHSIPGRTSVGRSGSRRRMR